MTPIELISTFRKKIHRSTLLALLVLLAVLIFSFFYEIPKTNLFDLNNLLSVWPIAFGIYIYVRRVRLLDMFKNKPEEVVTELEEYLERKNLYLNKTRMIIFVVMGVLLVATLYKVFFSNNHERIGNVVLIWAAAIVFFALDAWVLMKDRMMLQDLKHAIRENYSEIS